MFLLIFEYPEIQNPENPEIQNPENPEMFGIRISPSYFAGAVAFSIAVQLAKAAYDRLVNVQDEVPPAVEEEVSDSDSTTGAEEATAGLLVATLEALKTQG